MSRLPPGPCSVDSAPWNARPPCDSARRHPRCGHASSSRAAHAARRGGLLLPKVFEGFTVVELADRRNQLVGKIFSDGGARVITVEPVEGSGGRWCGPFVDDKPDPNKCLDY